jgi:hypothetical protein
MGIKSRVALLILVLAACGSPALPKGARHRIRLPSRDHQMGLGNAASCRKEGG